MRTISCVRTRTHSGVMFQCFPEPPRGEEGGGEQGIVERRNANKRENEKEGGREAAAESVTSS